MGQVLCHLWGDYILQSDWMAQNKTKQNLAAAVHAGVYTLAFILLRPSQPALAVIMFTHFAIDRYRLARYVVWAKNWMGPREHRFVREIAEWHWIPANWPWRECTKTGYPPDTPDWMAVWLLIIADNTIHLTINYLALRFLP